MSQSYRSKRPAPQSPSPASSAGAPSRNPFVVLAMPGAFRLWFAGIAFNIVRWLEMLAFALFALELTGSPFVVALTTFARLAPMLAAPLTTALVDGRDRRSLLLVLCVVLVAMDATLLVLVLSELLAVWHLLLAALASGFCWTIENPVRRTMLAEIAGMERVSASMGLDVASSQAMRGVGPVLGGLMIETTALPGIFTFGVALHVLAFFLIWSVGGGSGQSVVARGPSFLRSIGQALAYVRRHRTLCGTLAITAIYNMFGFPYVSLAPVIGERVLDLSPSGIGMLLGMEATSGCVASILIAAWFRPAWFVPVYTLGTVGFMICTLSFGLAHSVTPAFAVLLVAGFGSAAFASMQMTIPLRATPPELRVRMLGLVTVSIGASTLGFLHAGWLAEWLGAAIAQRVISIEGLVAIALIVWTWPEMLRFRAPEPLPSD